MLYTKKVDFHSHILTPSYYAYLDKYEGPEPDHFATPKWTEEGHMKLMDSLGVAYSSLSVSSPHPIQATAAERLSYVTNMNAEALDVVSRHPNRLGLFASLPLPDVDAACKMAEEMLSKEGVDGIGMLTNYNGIYLGSDKLDPLMEVLNAKSAVVD
ncbi:MAG TPA: amidohydrolase family protein, partial [Clostridiales bacterium]|nr:amidohydrolase family protein [Clostridiales bacterium]